LRVKGCLDERSLELAAPGLLKTFSCCVNSLGSERSTSNRSARSFNAAASKLSLTIASGSAGKLASARRLPMTQQPLQQWLLSAQYF